MGGSTFYELRATPGGGFQAAAGKWDIGSCFLQQASVNAESAGDTWLLLQHLAALAEGTGRRAGIQHSYAELMTWLEKTGLPHGLFL